MDSFHSKSQGWVHPVRFDLGTDSAQRQSPTRSSPSRPDRGHPTHYGWRAPVTLLYKRKVGAAGARTPKFAMLPKTHRQNPNRSRGAQPATGRTPPTSLESTAPPLSLLPRRRRHRPRRHRAGLDVSAPLVAAFERISITEPEMAGSSSASSGGEGPLPSLALSLCICCRSRTLVLRTKER